MSKRKMSDVANYPLEFTLLWISNPFFEIVFFNFPKRPSVRSFNGPIVN